MAELEVMVVKRKMRERMEGRERRGRNVEGIQAVVRDLEGEDEVCQIDH